MRKILALAAVAAVAFVLPAPASGETITFTVPFEATLSECGNTVNVSGELFFIVTFHQTPNNILVGNHAVGRNISGTDELGRKYVGTITNFNINPDTIFSGANTFTLINRFHIVGTGGAPTLFVTETAHITVSPSGETVVEFANRSAECV